MRPPRRSWVFVAISVFLTVAKALELTPRAQADSPVDILPYRVRSHSYSPWGTTTEGDIRTVGMAGATVGLADTFIASLDNPAGLAMTLNGADANFASNVIYNGQVQNFDSAIYTNDFGVAMNEYPWGFSLGYIVPYGEGQFYQSPSAPKTPLEISILTREFRFSAARTLLDNRLAVGASLILGQGSETLKINGTSFDHVSYALGGSLGATYQLPKHFLLAASFKTAMHYAINSQLSPTPIISNFFQPIDSPARIGLGLGWIPNRFLRMDFSTFIIGDNSGSALVRDDTTLIGQGATLQPRIGAAYNFLDFKELKGTVYLGNYLETSRIQNEGARFHQTLGFELKPWIATIGGGLDYSNNYRNYIFSIGIDIVVTMAKLDIIPTAWHPPYAGLCPKPTKLSDEDLPRPMVKDWKPHGPDLNPIRVGLKIPGKLENIAGKLKTKVNELKDSLGDMFQVDPKRDPSSVQKPQKTKGKNKRPVKRPKVNNPEVH